MVTAQPDPPGSADRQFGFRTRSVHAGGRPDPTTGARAVPIYQTTSFVFRDTAEAANLFALQTFGSIYSRISNPTVAAFEERLASLEGGIGAMGTASGQAAEFLTMASLAGAGDHLVASAQLYGGTRTLFDVTLRRFGVDTTFVQQPEPDDVAAAITPQTKAIYAEVIANPSGMVADLAGLADVAHANDLPLVVDSTTATPYLCRPIEHGADIVLHSVTKFVGGHGTSIGGAVVESGRFPWDNGRFPLMTEPIPSYGGISWWGNFAEYGFLTRLRSEQLRDIGAMMTPFNAFLFLMGLETLALRMRQHVENAVAVAEFLADHECVDWVSYAGLPDSPWYDRAKRYLPDGAGAVFAFGLKGGRQAGVKFIESCRLASHLANIGDARTLIIHPASTTHQQLSDEALHAGGITPGPGADLGRPRRRRRHLLGPRPRAAGSICVSVITSARERLTILRRTRTVAIVGMSANPARASHFVATYLNGATDWTIWYVNPGATEILGQKVYASLADLPAAPDIVDTFRRVDDLPAVADEAIACGAATLWFQLGLRHDAAADRAAERRARRRPGSLPEDRARPVRRWSPPGRVRHRRHRRPPRATRVAAWTARPEQFRTQRCSRSSVVFSSRGGSICWRPASSTTGSTRARGRAGTRTPTSRWASGATT